MVYQEALYLLMIKTYPYTKTATEKIKCSRKLFQDIQHLRKNLPVQYSNSIFVRIDELNPYFMKIAITGCRGTPYDSGLFFFDIEIPSNYPIDPPKVMAKHFRNRINPSIYQDGRVVMSLLNNWNGDSSEKWNPKTSNLYQVFVSIQSLLLNPKPYFNEVCRAGEVNTRTGEINSSNYNHQCYINTLNDLVIQPLCKPPEGFEDVVKLHFGNKRCYIEDLLFVCWTMDIKEGDSAVYEKIKAIEPRLKSAFDGTLKEDDPPAKKLPVPVESSPFRYEDDDKFSDDIEFKPPTFKGGKKWWNKKNNRGNQNYRHQIQSPITGYEDYDEKYLREFYDPMCC